MGTPIRPSFSYVNEPFGLHDVLEAIVMERFVAGAHPVGRVKRLERVRPSATLLPAGVTPSRTAISYNKTVMLVEGPGWVMSVERCRSGVAEFNIAADSDGLAKAVLEECTRDAVEAPSDTTVPVAFWHRGRHGGNRNSREIAAPLWAAVRGNYTARVAAAFDRLSVLDPSGVDGRLLLLHGPPGTGKTTALRSLASAWRGWCGFEVVVDT